MESQRRIPIPGTYNFRDPGGYAADGGAIRQGVLFRSDGLHSLGEAGRDELRQLGVTTVIDLRDDVESSAMPDDLDGLDVTVIRHPVSTGSITGLGKSRIAMANMYQQVATQHSQLVVDTLREISASGGGVLVHCTAGKDRTGIVVALALLAVGVDLDVVVADYATTEGNLRGEWLERMVGIAANYGVEDTPETRKMMGGSPPEAMSGMIELLEEEYGSIRHFLASVGFGDDDVAELRSKLVAA